MLDNVDKNHKNLQWITWKGAWALSPLQTSAGRDLLRFPGEQQQQLNARCKKRIWSPAAIGIPEGQGALPAVQ